MEMEEVVCFYFSYLIFHLSSFAFRHLSGLFPIYKNCNHLDALPYLHFHSLLLWELSLYTLCNMHFVGGLFIIWFRFKSWPFSFWNVLDLKSKFLNSLIFCSAGNAFPQLAWKIETRLRCIFHSAYWPHFV